METTVAEVMAVMAVTVAIEILIGSRKLKGKLVQATAWSNVHAVLTLNPAAFWIVYRPCFSCTPAFAPSASVVTGVPTRPVHYLATNSCNFNFIRLQSDRGREPSLN
jgi:hypothetical protein